MTTLNELHISSPALRHMGQTISISPAQTPASTTRRHVLVITGPAGCGKSSVANYIAQALGLLYIEGDDFHSEANVKKMSNGIPLTDDDRWEWLETLRNKAVEVLTNGAPGCVVTCSALKRKYRDVIRLAGKEADDVMVRFVYLRANEALLLQRVRQRQNHYMKDDMVKSQFTALEEPDETETDVLPVDVSGTLQQVQSAALRSVEEVMHK
ncbi:P-loop containing nucleoside triphosphate hydrolase protein [Peziza echinospora]|nr:P-loop containing nucleoside triphosphate hydrolase protein [Peziza echinospora]